MAGASQVLSFQDGRFYCSFHDVCRATLRTFKVLSVAVSDDKHIGLTGIHERVLCSHLLRYFWHYSGSD